MTNPVNTRESVKMLAKIGGYILIAMGLVLLLLLAVNQEYARYEALKKFYPDLTFRESMLLRDSFRLTPKEK